MAQFFFKSFINEGTVGLHKNKLGCPALIDVTFEAKS